MLRTLLARVFAPSAPGPVAKAAEPEPKRPRLLEFSTTALAPVSTVLDGLRQRLAASLPRLTEAGQAMDAGNGLAAKLADVGPVTMAEALFSWYGAQTFIGYQMCAILAQHWLIDKACSMPARDAIRQGFTVTLDDAPTDQLRDDALTAIHKASKRYEINRQMQEWVRLGRIFGVRIAIFQVESTDASYYERPFNPDSVTPGSFKGIAQVDPYWCTPELNAQAVTDPSAPTFYDPTWWVIAGKRYHRSHLCIFRTAEPADILKPLYLYGGVPVPQRIMERVYAAERTANEAPQLAMTKRLTVWNTNVGEVLANEAKFAEHMANFIALRDNYGLKINDTEDQMQQFETSLSDLDETILTQYQLVAAAAGVPETKLMGKAPKGFNATGEYDEASYHEELETVQSNDLTKFLDHYFKLVLRSEVEPKLGVTPGTLTANVEWNPLDSPTGKEEAEINKVKAERDEILVNVGAIDGNDVRNRIRVEKDSDYTGIEAIPLSEVVADPLDAAIADLTGGEVGADPLEAATAALTGAAGAPGAAPAAAPSLEAATAALTAEDALELPTAAGIVLIRPDGKALWVKRSRDVDDAPGKWAWPGGKIDDGEKPQDAALRELYEETGINYGAPIIPVGVQDGFVIFVAVSVAARLDVLLEREHTEYRWQSLDDPPTPLHPAIKKFLA